MSMVGEEDETAMSDEEEDVSEGGGVVSTGAAVPQPARSVRENARVENVREDRMKSVGKNGLGF